MLLRPRAKSRLRDYWFFLIMLVMGLPLVIAVMNDAALTWDGAWYLFTMLNEGNPYIAHDRLIDAPLHLPVVWASQLSDNMAIPRIVFNIVHVVTPLIALLLSWWVVRKPAPSLIIWPIIAIGIGLLPGHINFISEGIKAYMLMWPLLLSMLVGFPAHHTAPMVMICLIVVLLHPAAVPIFISVAAAATVIARLKPESRRSLPQAAICLLVAAAFRYPMIVDPYETKSLGSVTLKYHIQTSTSATVRIALVLTLVATMLTLVGGIWGRWDKLVSFFTLLSVGVAGGFLCLWASDIAAWDRAVDFRIPVHFISLTLAFFAFLDAVTAYIWNPGRLLKLPRSRIQLSQAIAVVFALVLSLQSIAFGRAIDSMNSILASSDSTCVGFSEMSGMPNTPLNNWSTPAHSLLYQGYSPTRIMMPDEACAGVEVDGKLLLTGPDLLFHGINIDLLPLAWSLDRTDACWWNEPSGWYAIEDSGNGRLRWSSGNAEVRVFLKQPMAVTITGSVQSQNVPNSIDVYVNGSLQQTLIFPEDGQPVALEATVELPRGQNLIRFESTNPAGRYANDSRDLAFAMTGLTIQLPEEAPCYWRE